MLFRIMITAKLIKTNWIESSTRHVEMKGPVVLCRGQSNRATDEETSKGANAETIEDHRRPSEIPSASLINALK